MAGLESQDIVIEGRIFNYTRGISHPSGGVPEHLRAIETPYSQEETDEANKYITRVDTTTGRAGPIRKDQIAYKCSWPRCTKTGAAHKNFTRKHDAERHVCEQMFDKKVFCPFDGCAHQSKQKEHMTTHINAKHLADLGLATYYLCRGCPKQWLDASPRNKHEKKCEAYLNMQHNGQITPTATRRSSTTTTSSTETDATMSNTEAVAPMSSTEAQVTMGNTEADMTMTNNVGRYSQIWSSMMNNINDPSNNLMMSEVDMLYNEMMLNSSDSSNNDMLMDFINTVGSDMMLNSNTDLYLPNSLMTNNFSMLDTDPAMTLPGLDPDNLNADNSMMLNDISNDTSMDNSPNSEAPVMNDDINMLSLDSEASVMNNDTDMPPYDADMPSLYIDPALLQNSDLAMFTPRTLEEINGQEEGEAGSDESLFAQFCSFDEDTQMV